MSVPIGILIPEQVWVYFQPAHPLKRAVAAFIDLVLVAIVLGVIWIVSAILKESFLSSPAFLAFLESAKLILISGVTWCFNVFYELNNAGQTPGKKYLRIRVICTNGSELSIGDSGIRNIIRIADFLPFGYILGGLFCIFTKHGQRIGDLVAGTAVINEPEA